jgi:hypothetical protein
VERPGLFRALSGCQALIFDTEPVTEMVRHAKRGSAFKTAAWRAPALWTLDTPGGLCYINGCAVAWCADRTPLKHFQSGRPALHHGRRKLENTSSSPSKSLAWEAPVLWTLDATLTGRGRVVLADRTALKHFQSGWPALHHGRRSRGCTPRRLLHASVSDLKSNERSALPLVAARIPFCNS